jgi:hypothetical protein
MSRQHLTETLVGFFAAFSKVHPEAEAAECSRESSPGQLELEAVMSRQLAYTAYIAFHHLLGGTHIEATVPNIGLVRELSAQHQATLLFPAVRPYCFRQVAGMASKPCRIYKYTCSVY